MPDETTHLRRDNELLLKFGAEIKSRVPHVDPSNQRTTNPSPLVDLTQDLVECARAHYGVELSGKSPKVYGKLESKILGGSVKVRPAAGIIEQAIESGKLRSEQTIFEATSGNFGLALGMLRQIGLNVIVLVSRKLQGGVLDELENENAKTISLDVDICPAPGLKMDQNLIVAKAATTNVRGQLAQLGLDLDAFDKVHGEVESLLAKQDVIGLAKLLAKVYHGFCPEQYDNELNVKSHQETTAVEIDQQLTARGHSPATFKVITAFGTGGTSTGLSRYALDKYGKKTVHVVFPSANQDVAGIRTRDKAVGLKFYQPELYAGEHEVDFQPARKVLKYFVSKGYDIGESSALALYSCIQMLNYGSENNFVVILADGIQKYLKNFETTPEKGGALEVTIQQANSNPQDYESVIWTHSIFKPREEGLQLVASAIGVDPRKIKIARAGDIQAVVSTGKLPETLESLVPKNGGRVLLICMAGNTSLRMAEILANNGVPAQSLTGGIMGLPDAAKTEPDKLVQIATE
ncbi:MAG TPA: pyridoxal-phosphate dependent enzyme [Candidatus Bathyarchaeia archaeon]|nr:pyridoxal-phosphate dependent enzyme [Candidatus Bathyarchaeia archaeon]